MKLAFDTYFNIKVKKAEQREQGYVKNMYSVMEKEFE